MAQAASEASRAQWVRWTLFEASASDGRLLQVVCSSLKASRAMDGRAAGCGRSAPREEQQRRAGSGARELTSCIPD